MTIKELQKIVTPLREGKFQIVLQDYTNPKKNKTLIYNGNSSILDEKPIIYLVEK